MSQDTTIIAFINQKGGVGKTTSSMNVGSYFANSVNKKTLMIDLDPQCNLSRAWGIGNVSNNIYSLLLGEGDIKEAIVEINDHLFIIPSSKNLARYEKIRAGEINAQLDLKKVLTPLLKFFDFIILDCPPALGLISVNALASARFVYVPVEAQLFSMDGLKEVHQSCNEIKTIINPTLELGGIFFTRYEKNTLQSKDAYEALKAEYGNKLMDTCISRNVALGESPNASTDIFSYAPASTGAKDYRRLSEEILKKTSEIKH